MNLFIKRILILSYCLLIFHITLKAQVKFVEWDSMTIGAEQTELYLPILKGKKVGIVANHTSYLKDEHLVDFLLSKDCNIVKIFGLEHGFRGNEADGALIDNEVDQKTGIPIVSLYGKKKRASKEDLEGIEVIIFDIQDVGVRFYTYLNSMCYMIESCAENDIEFVLLDRPNPNGFYVDGPILEEKHKSFVGIHPIPIVHGMTFGEYAYMAIGEGWIKNGKKCKLNVVKVKAYDHNYTMALPIKPSPNLPTHHSILLYPSLALFEGTNISVGRGTSLPFEQIGNPDLKSFKHSFKPISIKGVSVYPPHKNKICFGLDLQEYYGKNPNCLGNLNLDWILKLYKETENKDDFFKAYFYKLSGVDALRWQIYNGRSEKEIKNSWANGLDTYKKIRAKYLLYPDFK